MLKKILLSCSLISFAIAFSDIGTASQWGVSRPLGAVLLLLSIIVMLLEKETALYDAEERKKMAGLSKSAAGSPANVSQPNHLGKPRATAQAAF
jgi:hypothetical protein